MTDEHKIIEVVVDVEDLLMGDIIMISRRIIDNLSTSHQTVLDLMATQIKVVREDGEFWEIKARTDEAFTHFGMEPHKVTIQEPSHESALIYWAQEAASARGPVTLDDPVEFVYGSEVIKNDLSPLTGVKEIKGLEPYLEAHGNRAKGSGTPFYNSLRIAMRNRTDSGIVDVFDASGSMRQEDFKKAAVQLSKPLNEVEGITRSMYSGDSK